MAHILPFRGQPTYDLEVAGTVRTLPLIQVAPDTWIAYYYSLGDTEVIDRAARLLAPKVADCDIFVTTETKGLPLTHAIATYLGLKPYVCCRKEIRPFMLSPLVVRYKPITAKTEQELFMDGRDAMKIKGKRVGIVDDIVSTGETLHAMEELVKQAGGKVVAKAAILLEGEEIPDIHRLGILPVFKLIPESNRLWNASQLRGFIPDAVEPRGNHTANSGTPGTQGGSVYDRPGQTLCRRHSLRLRAGEYDAGPRRSRGWDAAHRHRRRRRDPRPAPSPRHHGAARHRAGLRRAGRTRRPARAAPGAAGILDAGLADGVGLQAAQERALPRRHAADGRRRRLHLPDDPGPGSAGPPARPGHPDQQDRGRGSGDGALHPERTVRAAAEVCRRLAGGRDRLKTCRGAVGRGVRQQSHRHRRLQVRLLAAQQPHRPRGQPHLLAGPAELEPDHLQHHPGQHHARRGGGVGGRRPDPLAALTAGRAPAAHGVAR